MGVEGRLLGGNGLLVTDRSTGPCTAGVRRCLARSLTLIVECSLPRESIIATGEQQRKYWQCVATQTRHESGAAVHWRGPIEVDMQAFKDHGPSTPRVCRDDLCRHAPIIVESFALGLHPSSSRCRSGIPLHGRAGNRDNLAALDRHPSILPIATFFRGGLVVQSRSKQSRSSSRLGKEHRKPAPGAIANG